jgi:F-type H+-transporting ATPase subunit gamma
MGNNTRDIRRRIRSVKSTAQITKAMQMVAASKMRKAQDSALRARPYAQMALHLLRDAIDLDNDLRAHPLIAGRDGGRTCALVVTTDRGLCGSLNTNLLRMVNALPADTEFVTVGRKGRAFLAKTKRRLLADFPIADPVRFTAARQVGRFLLNHFAQGNCDRVDVIYTKFVNTVVQKPATARLLPFTEMGALMAAGGEGGEERRDGIGFKLEPSPRAVLDLLLPHAVNFEVFHALLEARASEHSARMVAMKNATDNAKQLIKDLTLEYNKARQAGITNEILEIAAAAAAMG